MNLGEAIKHLQWMAAYEDERAAGRDKTIEALRLVVALFPKTRRDLTLLWKALEGQEILEHRKGYIVHLNPPVPLALGLMRDVGLRAWGSATAPEDVARLEAIAALTIEDGRQG